MSLENILTELDKLSPEQAELKTALGALIRGLNTEKGTALSDLNDVKGKNKDLLGKVGDLGKSQVNYDTLMGALKKVNINIKDAKDADELAKMLNIEKSESDKINSLESIIGEKDNGLKEANAKLRGFEVREKVQPKFNEAVKDFKDKDGNPFTLQDHFIKEHAKALYEDPKLDFDSEPLLNDAITKALQQVYTEQSSFMEATGATFNPKLVHDVNVDGNKHHQQGAGPDLTVQAKNITDSRGSAESCATFLSAAIAHVDSQNQ